MHLENSCCYMAKSKGRWPLCTLDTCLVYFETIGQLKFLDISVYY